MCMRVGRARVLCAVPGVARLAPRSLVRGALWDLGGVRTAEWTGVGLVEVLERAGVGPGALEVVFRGIDSGTVDGRSESIRFERSLGIGDARGAQVLLAHAMNGEPLPVQH